MTHLEVGSVTWFAAHAISVRVVSSVKHELRLISRCLRAFRLISYRALLLFIPYR